MSVEKHLRVTILRENALGFIKDYIVAFSPVEYVCYFEKKTEDNPHIHCYLKYHNDGPTKQKVSEFMKKQPLVKNSKYSGSYYHKAQHKTKEANIVYTIKDGDEILKNIDIEEYKIKTELINKNKKLSSKEKLYNIYIEKYGPSLPSSKFEIFKFIDEIYCLEWDKSPIPMGHKCSYSIYIIMKINKESKEYEKYEFLLKDLYGIKNDYSVYEQAIIKAKNMAFLEIQEQAQALVYKDA